MIDLPPSLPPSLPATRDALHRVAAHVLARRRHAFTGLFGLRPSPGGIATPAFGDDVEAVRTSGATLVVEKAGVAVRAPLATLGGAADLVGVDLGLDFAVGDDTPPLGDPDAPLAIDGAAARLLGAWYGRGLEALDEAVAAAPAVVAADVAQLWPEHFDLGCAVTVTGGARANLGASPGDGFEGQPYLYVGPWGDERPGDAGYWNAPFGAVLRYGDLVASPPGDRPARAVAFLRTGLGHIAGGAGDAGAAGD